MRAFFGKAPKRLYLLPVILLPTNFTKAYVYTCTHYDDFCTGFCNARYGLFFSQSTYKACG